MKWCYCAIEIFRLARFEKLVAILVRVVATSSVGKVKFPSSEGIEGIEGLPGAWRSLLVVVARRGGSIDRKVVPAISLQRDTRAHAALLALRR